MKNVATNLSTNLGLEVYGWIEFMHTLTKVPLPSPCYLYPDLKECVSCGFFDLEEAV